VLVGGCASVGSAVVVSIVVVGFAVHANSWEHVSGGTSQLEQAGLSLQWELSKAKVSVGTAGQVAWFASRKACSHECGGLRG
jgi:hypothetical protein